MIKYCLSLMVLSFSLFTSAASLDELKAITSTPNTLSGTFTQAKYLAQLDTSLRSTGEFHYLRDKEITWHTLTPIDSRLKLTPETMSNYQNGKQVNKMDSGSNPVVAILSDIFFAVMTAQWQVLETYFTVNTKVADRQWQATLTPLNANIGSFANKIILQGDQYLRHITLYEAEGNRTQIDFSQLQP
ncbi:outer membrane lipoprotein carrier protein LolA [Marinomonas transparens]|uniref:Outer membrane lipoprotein carrier protein LolA n=1 Tax=Marinomonas transparens TaxID=2795388 RepID=A0A934JUT9_9GAMM|nr:outer membrane lipoprotein carrier protein LolA [Marinomonas transparens]MBJ7538697.1 outer membrane lipoprotein carrier protein LolA [Marinomonas transparens]